MDMPKQWLTPKSAFAIGGFCFAAVIAIIFIQLRAPEKNSAYRYEIARGSVRRVRWFHSSAVTGAELHAVLPAPEPLFWAAVLPERDDETEGIAIFRENGNPWAFLPDSETAAVTSISASPQTRVLAILREGKQTISFRAYPELNDLGSIHAVGPVLWNGAVSGMAFTPEGTTLSFTMAPEQER